MNRSYPRRSEVGGVWVERMQYRGWGEETRLGATASLQVNCAIWSNGGSTIFQKRGVIESTWEGGALGGVGGKKDHRPAGKTSLGVAHHLLD